MLTTKTHHDNNDIRDWKWKGRKFYSKQKESVGNRVAILTCDKLC
jgi:hypothetical protein